MASEDSVGKIANEDSVGKSRASKRSAVDANLDEKTDAKVINNSSEESCCICLSSDDLLPNHGCNQCKENAWCICKSCHFSRLSRQCPICNGDYAPSILYLLPWLQFPMRRSQIEDKEQQFLLTMKTAFILKKEVLLGNNMAVYLPDQSKLVFCLPQDTTSDAQANYADEFIIASTSITQDSISNNIYEFTNKTWDMLEYSLEHTSNETEENIFDASRAHKVVIDLLKIPGAKLLHCYSPDEWTEIEEDFLNEYRLASE